MGKKRVSALGSEDEAAIKAKKAVKLEQKKLREGKSAKPEANPEVVLSSTVPEMVSPDTATPPAEHTKTANPHQHKRSKTYHQAKGKIDAEKVYSLKDSLLLLRQVSVAKFDSSVELHVTLKDKGFHKEVELPFSTGKTRKIAVADDATVAAIEAGKIDFDVLLASSAQMPKLVKLARILGPKGLMPNPKNGTVVANPEAAAKTMASKNSLILRTEKDAPIIHVLVGKLSQKDEQLSENIQTVIAVLPPGARKIVLKSTMSPAIKIRI